MCICVYIYTYTFFFTTLQVKNTMVKDGQWHWVLPRTQASCDVWTIARVSDGDTCSTNFCSTKLPWSAFGPNLYTYGWIYLKDTCIYIYIYYTYTYIYIYIYIAHISLSLYIYTYTYIYILRIPIYVIRVFNFYLFIYLFIFYLYTHGWHIYVCVCFVLFWHDSCMVYVHSIQSQEMELIGSPLTHARFNRRSVCLKGSLLGVRCFPGFRGGSWGKTHPK